MAECLLVGETLGLDCCGFCVRIKIRFTSILPLPAYLEK